MAKENMDEKLKLMDQKIKADAEVLYERYRDQMDLLKGSLLGKVKGGIEPYDVYALGKQLEAFDTYIAMCEDDGNLGQLGKIPQIAYDVITVAYGTSVVPFIASVQPIEEESGHVYFKQIRADQARGNMAAGDVMIDPRTGVKTPSGYASNYISGEVAAVTVGGVTHYAFTTAQTPIRPQTIRVTVDGITPYAFDDGLGVLQGVGLSGTVTYFSGAIVIDFAANPGAGHNIYLEYQVNFEQADDLPRISSYFDSTSILARVYALKGTIGMLQSYGMRKRFGLVAEDELAKDLVAEINAEIGGDLIRLLAASYMGNTNWPKTPPANVSYYEHKQTFKDSLADSEAVLVGNAQRGTISTMIAGRNACAIMQTLPGFNKLTDGNTLGAHVFGTLDGVMIIRVNEAAILNPNYMINMWKGTSPFEAPCVYSPFMPLVVTSTLPAGKNPIGQQRAAAVWAGVKVLVAQFITRMTVT